ncbi:MAG TPA: redoxin domain-containing protein, partial [Dehalococcoidia bacterium]|nr:redoxin domain-containing protein [Dehalococcoidia bacterium]
MELQQQKDEFATAGIEVFAISYDRQDAQAAFAEQNDIDFHLLADDDSAVIKQYGILNTLIAEDEGVYGIPFPGSY